MGSEHTTARPAGLWGRRGRRLSPTVGSADVVTIADTDTDTDTDTDNVITIADIADIADTADVVESLVDDYLVVVDPRPERAVIVEPEERKAREIGFIAVAAAYSLRYGIAASTWLEVGVGQDILAAAGVLPSLG